MSHPLGRGLNSLIPKKTGDPTHTTPPSLETEKEREGKEIIFLPPFDIVPNPHQPRKHFDEEALSDLTESIRVHGILQPLVVSRDKDGRYELIAGERRLRAAQKLHLKSVPVIVRSPGELEKLELSLIENIQRKDLSPIEKAKSYQKLVDEFSLTHEAVAKRLGKSRTVVSNTLRLLGLPEDVQTAIGAGKISEGQARMLLELKDQKQQRELFEQMSHGAFTVSDASRFVTAIRGSKNAKRKLKTKNPEFLEYEETLSHQLGTKVNIRRRGKGGVLEIEFYTEEELMGIVKKISSFNN